MVLIDLIKLGQFSKRRAFRFQLWLGKVTRLSLSTFSICPLHGIRTDGKVSIKRNIPTLISQYNSCRDCVWAKAQALPFFWDVPFSSQLEREGLSWYSHHCSCGERLLYERGETAEMEEKTDPSLWQQERGQDRINFEYNQLDPHLNGETRKV